MTPSIVISVLLLCVASFVAGAAVAMRRQWGGDIYIAVPRED
jgi:hypothetical protein